MKQMLSILGSTGSIGTQTLDVARRLGCVSVRLQQTAMWRCLKIKSENGKPQLVAVFDLDAAKNLRIAVADTPVRVVAGMEGLCEAASIACADVVCNSVVGMVGLRPTLAAIAAKKDVALANKETLVAAARW